MSLILDALKRAERERQLGQAPTALGEVTPPPSPPPGKDSHRGPVLLLIAVAVFALAGYVWFRIERGTPTSEVAAVQQDAPVVSAAAPAATPPAAATAVADVVSAQIEDGGEISSFDDLTGDASRDDELVEVTHEPAGDPVTAGTAVAQAAPVPPGPTLYTPSQPPEPAPRQQPEMTAPPSSPLAAAAMAVAPAPAIAAPAPSPIVLDPAPVIASRPSAESVVAASEAGGSGTHSIPSGPIVRFDADGNPLPDSGNAAGATAPIAAVEAPLPSPVTSPTAPPTAAPALSETPAVVPSATAPATAPVATRPPAALREAPPPSPSIAGLRRLKDMPSTYRAEFPALSVDVHVYNADPQRRFVLINGKRYREGDPLAEGPRLAEIVPDGMVVDWRGERVVYTLNR